jgi:hypothetical protein
MKSVSIVFSALTLAFATISPSSVVAGPVLHVVHCNSVHSGPDHGLSLNIIRDISLRDTIATLTSQSIAGPRPVASFSGVRVFDRRPVDGLVTYKARGFLLSVPARGGVSRLTFRTEGSNAHDVHAQMNCFFTR